MTKLFLCCNLKTKACLVLLVPKPIKCLVKTNTNAQKNLAVITSLAFSGITISGFLAPVQASVTITPLGNTGTSQIINDTVPNSLTSNALTPTLPPIATGSSLLWNVSNLVFADGSRASGSFNYDSSTNTYSNINLLFNTTTLGNISFSSADPFFANSPSFLGNCKVSCTAVGNNAYLFPFATPLTNTATSPISIISTISPSFPASFGITTTPPPNLGPGSISFRNVSNAISGSVVPVIGLIPSNPILPVPTPSVPGFTFPSVPVTPGVRRFFDPDIATGYDYSVTGGPNFASVLIPSALPKGDSNFTLELAGFGSFPLLAGTEFNLLDKNPNGFSSFRISGIDESEMLDPTNGQAFVTGLTFTNDGTVNVNQLPIVTNSSAVPEPLTILGAMTALGLGGALKKRQR